MPGAEACVNGRGPARADETRLRNEHIAATARLNKFDHLIAVPFICECSAHRCEELVRLTLTQFEAARSESDYLVAPGHQVDNARIVRVRNGVWLYRVEPVMTGNLEELRGGRPMASVPPCKKL